MAAKEKVNQSNIRPDGGPGPNAGIDVIFYTDPLCCWSWAMEPQWMRLQREFGKALRVSYRMIGLLPSWDKFNDSLSSLSRPVHMGPEWMQAGRIAGLKVADKIWITDPPSSSFPACIAVKSAEDQSPALGALYLKAVREAVIVQGKNIAQTAVLLDIAGRLSLSEPGFDEKVFRECLLGPRGSELFRRDYQDAQYLGIRRSPTLVLKGGGKALLLRGYQSWEILRHSADSLFNSDQQV
jgi:putative protein-disulfide isomerase